MKKIITGICVLVGAQSFAQDFEKRVYGTQFSSNAINLYSQDINSGNAKYIGVGGAMGALGSDISSAEQNPAGLGVAVASDFQVTGSFSNYKNSSTFATTINESANKFNLGQAGGVLVLNNDGSDFNRFAVSVSHYNQSINNTTAIGKNENINYVEPYGQFAEYYRNIDGNRSKTSFNISTSFQDELYLGIGVNYHRVSFTSLEQYYELDVNGSTYGYNLDGFPVEEVSEGYSFSLGAIYKLHQSVRIGAAYHSPVWSNVNANYYSYFEPKNAYIEYNGEYDITRGGRLVGSLGFVVNKSLSLGFDFTYHMNRDTKLKPNNNIYNPSNNFINDFVKNSMEYRIGAEYRIDNFRLRGGYNYVASPFKDFTIRIGDKNNNDIESYKLSRSFAGDINRFSFGMGYDFGVFYLDIAYQYQTQKYKQMIGRQISEGNDDFASYPDHTNGSANYVDPYNGKLVKLSKTYLVDTKLNNGLFLLTLGWKL